jgi:uncharacterized RDD family membrane protein YckC
LATATCSRCGNYACSACAQTVDETTRCATCAAQMPLRATESSRFAANLIDNMLPMLPAMLAGVGAALVDHIKGLGMVLMGFGGLTAVGLLAYNLYLTAKNGQSLGKRWMRIRVLRSNYEPVSPSRILLLRNLIPIGISVIPAVGSIFGFADAVFIFRKDRRCIHDHIADTIVVQSERL